MGRTQRVLLVAAVVAGAAARFATLDLQSYHHDEAVTAGRVLQPGLGDTLGEVVDGERSPPLYYLIAWLWSQLFGTDEVALRSLSALLGTAMIPAAFVAGRELASVRVGLIAAAFFALNPILVWYSQEARSYILMALMATLALVYFARALRAPSARTMALWALWSSLALASHYFAAFLIVPQALWLVFGLRARRAAGAVAAVALVAVALAPLAFVQQSGERRDAFTEIPLPGRVAEVGLDYFASEEPDPLGGDARVDAVQAGAGVAGLLLSLAACWLLLARGRQDERHRGLLLGGIVVAAVAVPAVAALVGIDLVKARNLMGAVVPVLLLVALGFGCARSGRLGATGALALCAVFAGVVLAVTQSEGMQRIDWRRAAAEIGPATQPRLLVVPHNGDDPLLYYLGAERFVGAAGRQGARVEEVVALSTGAGIDPPAGFAVRSRSGVPPLFTIWRLEAARPQRLDRPTAESVLRERSVVLLDEP